MVKGFEQEKKCIGDRNSINTDMRKHTLVINKTYNYRVVSPYKYSSVRGKWINQQLPHCAKVYFLSLRYIGEHIISEYESPLGSLLPFSIRSFPSGCRCFPYPAGRFPTCLHSSQTFPFKFYKLFYCFWNTHRVRGK